MRGWETAVDLLRVGLEMGGRGVLFSIREREQFSTPASTTAGVSGRTDPQSLFAATVLARPNSPRRMPGGSGGGVVGELVQETG